MALSNSIFIAGHRGMVGSALVRALASREDHSVLVVSRKECDLTRQDQVEDFFQRHRPRMAIIAAAKVGGIHANATYPAEFAYDNLMIATNCIHAAYRSGVERLLFLGSSCIYPRVAPQPIGEDSLLTSPLEPSNEAYAIAKIAGLKLCEYYRRQYGVMFHSVMPTNLYGPGDNYHRENSHVIPAMLRRFHEAKISKLEEVVIWGTGTPRREFLHVDDLADACLHLLSIPNPPDWVNAGVGEDISILELAGLVKETVGYTGRISHDLSKPDGTPRKLLNMNRMEQLGWRASRPFKGGLREAYTAFLQHLVDGEARL